MSADSQNTSQHADGKEQSLLEHLIELRDRLLRMVVAVLILFLVLFPFPNRYSPLLQSLCWR